MDFTICQFLGHTCEDGRDSPIWHAQMQVAACAHLLNEWLQEDTPDKEAVGIRLLVDVREVTQAPAGPETASLVNAGVFPALSPYGPVREPLSCEPIPLPGVATAVERALLGTPASRRVELMSAALRASIEDWAEEAALVRVADPAGGDVQGETHVVLLSSSSLMRLSVVRVDDRGLDRDPACSFAGHWCDSGARPGEGSHALTEARLRPICAGTALHAPLDLFGYGPFKIEWVRHGLPSSAGVDAIRTWWRSSAWSRRYLEDYLLDELPVPDDPQAYFDDPDNLTEQPDPLELGDPDTGRAWWGGEVGAGLQPLDTTEFFRELQSFRAACLQEAVGTEAAELVPYLLNELLDRPIRRVGGPERRLRVWADADEDGRFWRDATDEVYRYGHGRRLLILGPEEAMYIVFKDEQNP
ncbi:hypothetical protein SMD20_48170 [Nonomuraea sp. LP-02]|uniref:hypothetical protein n=1 Tax=Nonomuraea sp. LP-02 TaxID=3097960 RepID=UPI002E33B66F|nr:hypothetical protein [Nonomuraea sp. LP-02]MED7932068.1 hypothetical protein [Nonomuraea sp. LP-02]